MCLKLPVVRRRKVKPYSIDPALALTGPPWRLQPGDNRSLLRKLQSTPQQLHYLSERSGLSDSYWWAWTWLSLWRSSRVNAWKHKLRRRRRWCQHHSWQRDDRSRLRSPCSRSRTCNPHLPSIAQQQARAPLAQSSLKREISFTVASLNRRRVCCRATCTSPVSLRISKCLATQKPAKPSGGKLAVCEEMPSLG